LLRHDTISEHLQRSSPGQAQVVAAHPAFREAHQPFDELGSESSIVGCVGGATSEDVFPSDDGRFIRTEAVLGAWFVRRSCQSMFGPNVFASAAWGVGNKVITTGSARVSLLNCDGGGGLLWLSFTVGVGNR